MKFRNLTPHPVVVANGNLRIKIERNVADPVARVEQNIIQTNVDYELAPGIKIQIPLEAHTSYAIIGLPEPEPGVTYVVSSMVASRAKRSDVVSPITDATCERDEAGRVLSVRGFQTYVPDYREKQVEPERKIMYIPPVVQESFEQETSEELLPPKEYPQIQEEQIQKVDPDMLDPIKLAAKMKYEKRMAKTRR